MDVDAGISWRRGDLFFRFAALVVDDLREYVRQGSGCIDGRRMTRFDVDDILSTATFNQPELNLARLDRIPKAPNKRAGKRCPHTCPTHGLTRESQRLEIAGGFRVQIFEGLSGMSRTKFGKTTREKARSSGRKDLCRKLPLWS
jgi:hypothetical protein